MPPRKKIVLIGGNPTLTLGYVPYGTGQVEPFDQVFAKSKMVDPKDPTTFDGCDAIVIWGGADISPTIYNERVSTHTGAGEVLSARDVYEYKAALIAIAKNIPIIGICRGAQLVCGVAGGKLVQHVTGHHGDHEITTRDGRSIIASSVHHQMMFPWQVEHELIAWSTSQLSDAYVGGDDMPIRMPEKAINPQNATIYEPEIVYFNSIRALAIQGHPEFMPPTDPFVTYCCDLVRDRLLSKAEHHAF